MPMRIPDAGNPYSVDIDISNPTRTDVGLTEEPRVQNSVMNAFTGAVQGVGSLVEATQKWKAHVDNTQSMDLINELNDKVKDIRNNPETGYLTLEGKNAIVRPSGKSLNDEVRETFNLYREEILAKAGNPDVRARVQQFANDAYTSLDNDVKAHIIKQNNIYSESVQQKNISNAVQLALTGKPEESAAAFQLVRDYTIEKANKLGLEPDLIKTMSPLHKQYVWDALDEGNLREAERRLKLAVDKGEMSGPDIHSLKKAIKREKDAIAKKYAQENAIKQFTVQNTPEATLRSVLEPELKRKISDEEIQEATDLAGGNSVVAGRILAVGIDNYKKAVDEAERSGKPIDLKEKNEILKKVDGVLGYKLVAVSGGNIEGLTQMFLEKYPGMDYFTARSAAIKASNQNKAIQAAKMNDAAEGVKIAMDYIKEGKPINDLPASVKNKLPYEYYRSLQTYQERKDAGSLATNWNEYWDLMTNKDLLKSYSDMEWSTKAKDFDEKTYKELTERRQGIANGQVIDVNKSNTKAMVQTALEAQGILGVKGTEQKQVAGFVLNTVVEEISQNQALLNGGHPFTQEEVNRRVADMLKTKLTIPKFFFWTGYSTAGDAASGKPVEMTDELEEVFNEGLLVQGIGATNPAQRTNLWLEIKLRPNQQMKPNVASAMRAKIFDLNPKFVADYSADYRQLKGQEPTSEDIVRAYIAEFE